MGDVRFIMDLEAGECLSVVTMAAKGEWIVDCCLTD